MEGDKNHYFQFTNKTNKFITYNMIISSKSDQMLSIEPGPSLEGIGQDMTDENFDYTVEGKKLQNYNHTGTELDDKKLLRKEAKSKLISIEHTKYQVENATANSKGKNDLNLKQEQATPKANKSLRPGKVNKQSLCPILNVNELTYGSLPSMQNKGSNLTKGITVTARYFNLNQPEGDQSLNDLMESVEAQSISKAISISDRPVPSNIMLNQPEAGQEEASEVVAESEPELESEPEEPEFDYFGCETCKSDRKPVDKLKIILSHKCPICPCACFCAHLLKEHMKAIHGWFNVQRKFTTF